ncbi:hypothetical protein DFR76_102829 [Nocardia pseudobrasiliensis]|uniref:Uncharacterized protein n=2 Tax=Nocardia pseudobrasiliensis TaxID=45979 RepID=A0A370ICG2_9NOCA|nr:hypothetical protein DFR76_102829 [Nocardia pseudobrasiliensis]
MVNDLACPTCHSQDWAQSIPALRATGVATTHETGYYTGIGVASSGLVPVIGTSVTARTSSTALAASLAFEPRQVPTGRLFLLALLLAIPPIGFAAFTASGGR